ncbi:MAG: hypothetical protein J6Y91_02595 [Alphaproteobacteria bacterium]|nr:hypothetical protein [Alphaproteobacteria bacterium]
MSKKSKATTAMIQKVQKRKTEVKNMRQEQRDTPIPYARVHETPKNNPKQDRKDSKKIKRNIMRGDYE